MDVVILVLIALVFGGAALFLLSRQRRLQAEVELPPELARLHEQLEETADQLLRGESLPPEQIERVDTLMGALFEHYCQAHGVDDNTRWPRSSQLYYYEAGVRAAATDHPRQNAWPMASSVRIQVLPALEQALEEGGGPWVQAAIVGPALAEGRLDLALGAFERLSKARPDLAELVRRQASMAISYFPELNDVGACEAFIEATGSALPSFPPEDDPLRPAERWVLSVCIHPAYDHDPRLGLAAAVEPAAASQALSDWWDVTSAETLLDLVERLRTGLHDKDLRLRLAGQRPMDADLMAFVEEVGEERLAGGIPAWDWCRGIQVVRDAVAAGHIDEDEGWTLAAGLAWELRQRFSSWEELADNYRLGDRYFAVRSQETPAHEGLVRWLQDSPRSPWRRMPWRIDPEALRRLAGE